MNERSATHTNSLIHETSPYLLQHAYNPVNWHAWNEETLDKAKRENKLVLVSIGYSACHWCHVMEHESFEDEKVAQLMNDHFICIKVDREERPDVDQVYMLATQLMTGHGGWPLNCFTLPDLRPVFGGTYFPKASWMNILLNLADVWQQEPQKAIDYAEKLTEGVKLAELVKVNNKQDAFTDTQLSKCYENWKTRFDEEEGGPDKAPKFPLPNNYQFLLRYAYHTDNREAKDHVKLTLKKMAYGGIYDQLGGGFARYSVDRLWKVPHFEKMLYDNAQLVTLYSEAFLADPDPLYKQVVYETLEFVETELRSPAGGFYSALDADSEGEEGKYYVWTKQELMDLLGGDFELFADYFNINDRGDWEHGNYILLRFEEDETIAARYKLTAEELNDKIRSLKKRLLAVRQKRVRPGLDNKIITSWNALMLKGYVDAYIAFGEEHFLNMALRNAEFLFMHVFENERLLHIAGGKRKINGFLEDYAFTIEAMIALYEATFDEAFLQKAKDLMHYVSLHFCDRESGMHYFTSDEDAAMITRKMELSDNVIPASNSSIAKSLFILGHYFGKEDFIAASRKMLGHVLPDMEQYGAGYSNWAMLHLHFSRPFYELAIVGKSVDENRKLLQKHYFPNRIFAGSASESSLPLLKDRYKEGETLIYVCKDMTCGQPVKSVEEALTQINEEQH
ncbi:MAG: thioredoxin domain-containing protein [Bacteroidia bacterium]